MRSHPRDSASCSRSRAEMTCASDAEPAFFFSLRRSFNALRPPRFWPGVHAGLADKHAPRRQLEIDGASEHDGLSRKIINCRTESRAGVGRILICGFGRTGTA